MRKTRRSSVLILSLCVVFAFCGCQYSLIRFENPEAAVEYYAKRGELQFTVPGNDTLLAVYEIIPGDYGSVVLTEQDGKYRHVIGVPLIANINENYQICIYSFEFIKDRYMEVCMWRDDPNFQGLEIINDYGWNFQRAQFTEPGMRISVAGFTAEPGEYHIQVNGQIIRFSF